MKKRHPFTLIEVVAAIAVMLLVALIIGAASHTFYNAWKRTARITDRLKTNIAIDRVMDECVRGIIPFTWKDDNDTNQYVFDGKTESVFFVTMRRTYKGENGAFLFMKLYVEDNTLTAEYSFYPRFHWTEEGKHPFKKEILASNVHKISFLYANTDENQEIEWVDSWREYSTTGISEDDDFLPVPLAIQMKVEYEDGSSEVWLRRTAGNSKYTELSL